MRKFSAITHYEISRKQLLKALEELEVRAETKLDKLSDKNKLVTYSKSDDLLLKEELAEKERMIEELQNSLEATQEDLSKTNDELDSVKKENDSFLKKLARDKETIVEIEESLNKIENVIDGEG